MGVPALPPELAPLAAVLQASAGAGPAPEAPRHPRVGERKVPGKCRVIGCTADLRRQTPSNVKNRLCQAHWSAPVLVFRGVDNRFCSKCTRLRPLPDFDGEKRTCRSCLLSHTARRRAREAGAAGAGRSRADYGAGARSTSTSEEDTLQAEDAPAAFHSDSPAPAPTPAPAFVSGGGAGPSLADMLAAAISGARGVGQAPGGSVPAGTAAAPSPATLRRLAAAIKVEKLNMELSQAQQELAQAQQELAQAQLEETLGTLQGGACIPEQLLQTIHSLIRGSPNS